MSKRTSKCLDRELSRYNINEFPPELQKKIDETMCRPDFDPDKLAAALKEVRTETERCPWYESVGRIFMLLAGALILLGIFMLVVCGVAFLLDEMFLWDIKEWIFVFAHSHPYITIAAVFAVYLFCLFWLVSRVANLTQGEV